MLEDGLHQATHGVEKHLTRVHDAHATAVGEGTRAADGDVGIEARTGGVHIIEALCESHLGIVHVGTVVEQLNAHTR